MNSNPSKGEEQIRAEESRAGDQAQSDVIQTLKSNAFKPESIFLLRDHVWRYFWLSQLQGGWRRAVYYGHLFIMGSAKHPAMASIFPHNKE